MLFPSALRVCVSVSLLVSGLSACTPPLSTAPLNQRIQTSLPALAGTADADGLDIFSFRIITSPEKVDLFSVLQVERKPWLTLPVGQLREVIAAKQKISEMEFLQPEYATKLAYETSRFYNWDLELARQVLVEVVQAYVDHRDSKMDAYRRYAAERATYFIEANRREQEEVQRQSQAVIEKQFYGVPSPNRLPMKSSCAATRFTPNTPASASKKTAVPRKNLPVRPRLPTSAILKNSMT